MIQLKGALQLIKRTRDLVLSGDSSTPFIPGYQFQQNASPERSRPREVPEVASSDSGIDEDIASDSKSPTTAERQAVGSPVFL